MGNESNKRNDINPKGFTLGLALVDLLPVIFFGISAILIGRWLRSITFMLGSVLCVAAGLGKVIWKILLVTCDKNIKILSRQLRYLMPLGFLNIFIGLIYSSRKKDLGQVFYMIVHSPFGVIFIIPIVLMTIMFIMAFKSDGNKAIVNWIEEIINSIAQFCVLLGVVYFFFISSFYRATPEAFKAVSEKEPGIAVDVSDNYIAFIPDNATTGFIFYPGGNVEPEAYAPLMKGCAEKGILSIVVKMPDNLSFYDIDIADDVRIFFPEIEKWIIGGHSLGGAMATDYLAKNLDKYTGLVLVGSFADKDLSNADIKVLNIYGTEDEVVGDEKYAEKRKLLPADAKDVVIEGGCHAYFGYYGSQDGDGTPTIDTATQQKITIDAIGEMFTP